MCIKFIKVCFFNWEIYDERVSFFDVKYWWSDGVKV